MRPALAWGLALVGLLGCTSEGPPGAPGDDVTGPPGDPGEPGAAEPSLASVTPSRLYLGRDVEVLISGSGTRWLAEDPPEVDAGEGLEVVEGTLTVASPTALRVTLRVADAAPTGLRDLRVCEPSDEGMPCAEREDATIADKLLAIQPAVEALKLIGGNSLAPLSDLPQGSIVQAYLAELDPTTPFSRIPGEVSISLGPGSLARPAYFFDDYQLAFFMFVDVGAQTGTQAVIVESGPEGALTRSVSLPSAAKVVKRVPSTLFIGSTFTNLPAVDASLLYELPRPQEGSIVTFEVDAEDPSADADVYLLDESGRFADVRDFAQKRPGSTRVRALIPKAIDKLYLVYRGFGGGVGYPLEIRVSEEASSAIELDEPGADGAIAAPGEADWFSFVPAASGSVRLRLSGAAGDECGPLGSVDTELVVLADDGTRLLQNDDYGLDFCSGAVFEVSGGATYYVMVMSSRLYAPLDTFSYHLSYEAQ